VKVIVGIVVLVLLAASLFADWKWRKWIAERRRDRDQRLR